MLKLDLQHFGGRGASSGGSGNRGRLRRKQTDHEIWGTPPSLAEQLAKNNGISLEEAQRQVQAVDDYSGIDYRDIRSAWYNNEIGTENYRKAQDIENFIEQSPNWGGDTLYRGMHLADSAISQLQVGGRIDMRGMSSWSSSQSTAISFSNKTRLGESPVVFKAAGTKKGASITHLSLFGKSEEEILVSGKATWTINKIYKSGKTTFVEVSED